MRRAAVALVATSALVAGCSNRVGSFVAVGWRGTPAAYNGACPTTFTGRAVERDGEAYRAVAPGTAVWRCESGEAAVEVRVPDRYALEPDHRGPVAVGDLGGLALVAYDGDRALAIDGADVAWELPPALVAQPACSVGLVAMCTPSTSVSFRPAAAGQYTVTARWGDVVQRAVVTVTAAAR